MFAPPPPPLSLSNSWNREKRDAVPEITKLQDRYCVYVKDILLQKHKQRYTLYRNISLKNGHTRQTIFLQRKKLTFRWKKQQHLKKNISFQDYRPPAALFL